jgi:hypothetical protein
MCQYFSNNFRTFCNAQIGLTVLTGLHNKLILVLYNQYITKPGFYVYFDSGIAAMHNSRTGVFRQVGVRLVRVESQMLPTSLVHSSCHIVCILMQYMRLYSVHHCICILLSCFQHSDTPIRST